MTTPAEWSPCQQRQRWNDALPWGKTASISGQLAVRSMLVAVTVALAAVATPVSACSPVRDAPDPTAREIVAAARDHYAAAALVADVRVDRFDVSRGEIVYSLLRAWKGYAPRKFVVFSSFCGIGVPVEGARYRQMFTWSDYGFELFQSVHSYCIIDLYDQTVDRLVGRRRPNDYQSTSLPGLMPPLTQSPCDKVR